VFEEFAFVRGGKAWWALCRRGELIANGLAGALQGARNRLFATAEHLGDLAIPAGH
jgi:hypothetical protein